MRIIAGHLKGRKVLSAPLPHLRPTLGRVKETLFAILEHQIDINGAAVLDIFAGTGNLGLESLSRGAATVLFMEEHRDSVALIRQNCSQLKVQDQTEILEADCMKGIESLYREKRLFDLIIMDPPFRKDYFNRILQGEVIMDLLSPQGLLFCETEKDYHLDLPCEWSLVREKKIADSRLYYLKKKGDANS